MATVIDAKSRPVIGWAIAHHMRTDVIRDALTMAIVQRGGRPATAIFHSGHAEERQSEKRGHCPVSPRSPGYSSVYPSNDYRRV